MIILAEELSIISGAQKCVNVHLKPLLEEMWLAMQDGVVTLSKICISKLSENRNIDFCILYYYFGNEISKICIFDFVIVRF